MVLNEMDQNILEEQKIQKDGQSKQFTLEST